VRRLFAALVLSIGLAATAQAVEPGERLADPALEARAEALGETLRCLVCQNESIEESHADLAHDLRVLLRAKLAGGATDQQAVQAIVDRYGEFVLLDPPVRPATYLLWYGPPLLLLASGVGAFVWLRRQRVTVTKPEALSPDETKKLRSLLESP
jgi:cytochrome c-type biogenesis protein CcmH